MEPVAIISVDGHVKASRAGYREYFETRYLEAYDEWVKAQEDAGVPDAGNLNHDFGVDSQWDSDKRVRDQPASSWTCGYRSERATPESARASSTRHAATRTS